MDEKADYLIIGKVLKPIGTKGEIKVLPITDDIERFRDLPYVILKKGVSTEKSTVAYARLLKKYVILKLNDSHTRLEADLLKGQYLYIDRENALKIDESSYYYHDLYGCAVKTAQGEILGTVYDIQNAGSCDVYFLKSHNRKDEILIPAVSDIVKKIDINKKEIVVEVLEGLL